MLLFLTLAILPHSLFAPLTHLATLTRPGGSGMFSSLFGNGTYKKKPISIQKQTVKVAVESVRKELTPPLAPPKKTGAKSRTLKRKTLEPALRAPIFRKSVNPRRSHSSQPTADFSQADSESEDDLGHTPKKLRFDEEEDADGLRQLRNKDAFKLDQSLSFDMVHAADIPRLDKSTKYEPIFDGLPNELHLELQYPSASQRERFVQYLFVDSNFSHVSRFTLIKPIHDAHAFQAVPDILEVMRKVSEFYVPESFRLKFDDESVGFLQRFQRAVNKKTTNDIRKVLEEYNSSVLQFVNSGEIAAYVDRSHRLHPSLVERILNQTYSRTVSPNLKMLRKYQTGTDYVYGELLPRFVSDILRRDLKLKSNEVFVDLGSGVGNVVLQAALEIGCESWGCEIMKEYCTVAELQHAEFVSRCMLWGLTHGNVSLEKGDFLENAAIKRVLRKADAVLVNNQVFTPQLNEALTNLFLDLKDGCRVVSLKSFVPTDHKITARNLNSPYNVLVVEKKRYYSNCVSWTNEGGSYYVSTKDSKTVEAFLQRPN